MIDLHTHSLFSDGELIPSELVRRAEAIGYRALALTDHADSSNLDFIVPRIVKVAKELNEAQSVKVVPGVELTHIPPSLMGALVAEARGLGAALGSRHPGSSRPYYSGGGSPRSSERGLLGNLRALRAQLYKRACGKAGN